MRAVPNVAAASYAPAKNDKSQSLSQVQYPNHFSATTASADVQEQFEPTYVKLDKQVSPILLFLVAPPAGGYTTHWSCFGLTN